jgi:PAS domain S-box-containing protein
MKSQEKYLTILNNISDGVYVLNTDGYFTFVNQAIIDGSGIPSEKFYTLHYLDIVDPEYHDQAKRNFQRGMKGEEGIPYELRYTSFNGQIRIVEVHSKPIYDQGKINGLQGISRDITERRRAEEVLRRSEEKYRTVLNNASDAIVLGDEQGNLLEVNRKAEGLFGYPREELLRMHYTQLHPTIELETTVAAHRDIVTHGKGGLQKGVVLRKDGTVVPVDITATAIEYNGMRILQASFRDISDHKQTEDTLERLIRERTVELSEKNKQLVEEITERKQMEEEIKKERETFFTVLKNYPHGVALVDRNGVNQYVNPEFTEITGYTIEDIPTGRDWFQKAYPVREYRKKVINAWKADRVKTGIGVDRHFSITCKDGHVKDIEFRITFLENWSITVLNDITARKRAEEALKKRDRELEVKSRTLTEMNAALKILLKQREKDKDEVEANVLSHVKQLVMPYMEKLKKCRIGAKEKGYVSILESTMKEIVSPFSNKLSSKYLNLTPKEIEIANLIKEGKTTKEIGELSNVSPGTVAFHRNNIRIKLNLKNKKDNLRSYLLTLS